MPQISSPSLASARHRRATPLIRPDMDQSSEPTQKERLEGFNTLFYLTEAVGAILIILVGIWIFNFRGGLAWTSNPGVEFNWHPLLMTIGLVFLYANGMLIYRSQRFLHKTRLKFIHAGIMLFVVLLVIIAQIAVFDSHNLAVPPIPNLYSLHSWVGLATVILFCCQWVIGLLSFLYPIIQPSLRAAILPLHVYFGSAVFVGAIASCLLGLTEKIFFVYPPVKETVVKYADLPSQAVLVNIIGVFFVIFGGLTLYLVSQERYRRQPRPEDNVLLSNRGQ